MAGAFMKYNQYSMVWLIFAAIYLIGVVVVWSIGPETKGRSLDEVHGEA